MNSSAQRGLAAAVLAATLSGCTATTGASGQSAPRAAAPVASPAPTPTATTVGAPGASTAASEGARKPPHPADVRFMSAMISHHAQALVMAGWAPTHGASQSVRVLAERIVNGQNDEIHSMQQWLRERGQPLPDPRATGMRMVMNGVEHDMLMPGMLTEAQLKELDAARGADFDRLFLSFMIKHHQGAVGMVTELFATDGAAQEQSVFKLASDVQVDQTTEIERMQKMLVPYLLDARRP